MFVNAHAVQRIRGRISPIGRGGKTLTADIVTRLEAIPGTADDVAIEVYRHGSPITDASGSNGDSVVVIARGGEVTTVMLRRSWSQSFTPASLGVDRVAVLA